MRVFKKEVRLIYLSLTIILILVAFVGCARNKKDDFFMSDSDFSQYVKKPIGSIMAEVDYADDERLVFHYVNGFFVYDLKGEKIVYKIDLGKLNVAPHQQGSNFLEVNVSSDGSKAYLKSVGSDDEIKDFENYIIDLKSGEVKKGDMQNDVSMFSSFAETPDAVGDVLGWFSDRCVMSDEKTYCLTVRDNLIGSIELVTVYQDGQIEYKYILCPDYVSFSQRVSDTINAYLDKNGEKVAPNSGVGGWEILGSELKNVLDKENIDAKNLDEYKYKMIYATIFAVEKKDKSTADTLFVTDKEGKTVIFSATLKDGMTPKIYNELNKEF